MERAVPVAPSALPSFSDAIHPAPAADDALDVLGGPGAADCEQALLGLGSGHTRQRPDFRVRQLATGKGLSQQRQCSQGPRDAHTFPRCAAVEPDAPGEPRGAGAEAVTPAVASVELPDQIQQPRAGGVEMSGELGDLVAQSLELRNRFRRGPNGALKVAIHRRVSSSLCADSTPRYSTAHGASRTDDRGVTDERVKSGKSDTRAAASPARSPSSIPPCTPRPPAARRR